MLRSRYKQRFQDLKHLVLRSEVDALHYRGDGFVEPLEPDVDPGPQPSGWVVVTQDAWGAQLAAAVLPETGYIRDNAFLYAVGASGRSSDICGAGSASAGGRCEGQVRGGGYRQTRRPVRVIRMEDF